MNTKGKQDTTPYAGGCACGSVRDELTAEPPRLVACHCKSCQRRSGGAFSMSMLVKEDRLNITGTTKGINRAADSGNELTSFFRPECGVQIYAFSKLANGLLTLKPGTLDDMSRSRPTSFVWMKSPRSWVPVPDGVQVFDRGTSG